MMFLRCVVSITVLAIMGDAADCPSKTLIMAELTSKDFAIEVIKRMRKYKEMDSRLSEALVATMLYSADRHTEFLVPWNSDFTHVETLLTTFQKLSSYHPYVRLPYAGALPSTTTGAAPPKARKLLDTIDGNRPATGLRHRKKEESDDERDPLMQLVNLGLKFFRQNETGVIVVLTSSKNVIEETKLSDERLKAKKIPVVIGYPSDNKYLDERDSGETLKFVELSNEPNVKQSGIARFVLYSHCTSPELVKELQAMPNQRSGAATRNSEENTVDGSTYTSTLSPEASRESDRRKSTVIAAGSVAAASAGVAAISVFAGRWFYGNRPDEDGIDTDYSHHHYPSGGGEALGIETGERVYETPVPHQQTSLDIDSHASPELRRTEAESPVQHIAFTMF